MKNLLTFILIVSLCGCRSVQQRWVHAFGQEDSVRVADEALAERDEDEASKDVHGETQPAVDGDTESSDELTFVSFRQEGDKTSSSAGALESDGSQAETNGEVLRTDLTPDDVLRNAEDPAMDPTTLLPKQATSADETSPVDLEDVVSSVHLTYPLVFAAFQERVIADGNQVSAWGSFDTKLKAASENGPLGFYETYRNSAGLTKPIYSGGEFFAGYRIGDGSFQPWYKERETDESGEFKAGVRIPLIRDRDIDGRRAELWRSTYDRQIADPVIRSQLVMFSREAGLAYWKWVAAVEKYKIGLLWLTFADDRNARIVAQQKQGELSRPDVAFNLAAIAKRRAKLAQAENDVRQAAVKLSLYLRDAQGNPILLRSEQSPGFPKLRLATDLGFDTDVPRATAMRPELQQLSLLIRRLEVDYAEACNMTKAALDAQLVGSQDIGTPASSKGDKSEFELEAGLFFDMPLERRKGRGKMYAVQGKMAAVNAKRRMVEDKVLAEVQAVYAALEQTREQAEQMTQSRQGYELVAENERTLWRAGESDLLKVALQEQYALEAAEEQINALYMHFVSFTEYAAVMAIDRPSVDLLPPVPSPNADAQQGN